jgi:hypothetical protein
LCQKRTCKDYLTEILSSGAIVPRVVFGYGLGSTAELLLLPGGVIKASTVRPENM